MTEKKRDKAPRRRRATVPHAELVPGTMLTATLKGRTFEASVVSGAPQADQGGGVRVGDTQDSRGGDPAARTHSAGAGSERGAE